MTVEHFEVKHTPLVTITCGQIREQYPVEAWGAAVALAPVLNGTDGFFHEPRFGNERGSVRIAFIKALRTAFNLGLREAKFLMDAAQQEDAEGRLHKVLEPNHDNT
jgi:hypothetical protein